MAQPQSSGWVARSFTRARVVSSKLVRIPFADKELELPFTFNRVQLWALMFCVLFTVLAWGAGSVLGAASSFTTIAVMISVVVLIALGRLPVPARGSGMYIEGYVRAVWLSLPGTSRLTSSRPRPRSGERTLAQVMAAEAAAAGSHRRRGGGGSGPLGG